MSAFPKRGSRSPPREHSEEGVDLRGTIAGFPASRHAYLSARLNRVNTVERFVTGGLGY